MPFVSKPVGVDGFTLLDGGITDSVPFEFMESKGYDRNVVILMQPKGYLKEKSGMARMIRILLRKYPKTAGAMIDRYLMYNDQMLKINEREESGASVVIRPPEPLGIKRTEKDPGELERVYQIGREAGLKRLSEAEAFLRR